MPVEVDLDAIPLPAVRLDGRRVTGVNAAAAARFEAVVGVELPADGEVTLPGVGGGDRHALLHVCGTVGTLTDITELRQQFEAIATVSNAVLEKAEVFRHDGDVLQRVVRERTEELERANRAAVMMLAVASEAKDTDTGDHVRRVQRTTAALARELGEGPAEADALGLASVLHDVGKIHVPDEVLKKPGKLTDDERRIIERHTVDGERILSDAPFFATARRIARSHHEAFDGTGYPDRLAGEKIPMPARVVHVADVFDALTTVRVYKGAWSNDDAAGVIREGAGRGFDPDVVRAFDRLYDGGYFERGRDD